MKVAKYRTQRGAEKYARDLAKLFPKRQFLCVQHPYEFAWTVGMYDDRKFVAYVSRRKPPNRTRHEWGAAMSLAIVKQKEAETLIRKLKPKSVKLVNVSFPAGWRWCAVFDFDGNGSFAVKGTAEHTLRGWLRKVAPHCEVQS